MGGPQAAALQGQLARVRAYVGAVQGTLLAVETVLQVPLRARAAAHAHAQHAAASCGAVPGPGRDARARVAQRAARRVRWRSRHTCPDCPLPSPTPRPHAPLKPPPLCAARPQDEALLGEVITLYRLLAAWMLRMVSPSGQPTLPLPDQARRARSPGFGRWSE